MEAESRANRCGSYRMARWRRDLILDGTTRSLLRGLPGEDGRAAKSDTEGGTSPRSLRKAGLCAYSGLERMPELRETSVQMSSPGSPLTKKTAADYPQGKTVYV
ncbi:hypothetical protein EVAR_80753_1 [Eumeta japonica]|uniref:Uncharacterized protein n=1 Tax=Eumeta variegata TaxID=151549 RepID=A0A4C1X6J8_EUMVA|nr:hypothetical protein EVAR_80753_1 [Eumeta japonica]